MGPIHAILDAAGNVEQYIYPFMDGTLPPNAVVIPELALANAKEAKWDAVKAKRQRVEEGGAATLQGVIDSDPNSQRKVNGLVTMAMLAGQSGQSFSQAFTLADNSVVTLDGPAMIAVGVALGQHVSACHSIAQTLRDAIDAATSIADVEAIDADGAAWPS